MKILLITRNLPPMVGGMERLNWHMAEELAKDFEVMIIGPKSAETEAPERAQFIGIPAKSLWKFLLLAGWKSIAASRKFKPDIILAGSGLTAPITYIAAKLSKAKAITYIHGLDVTVPNILYRTIWIHFIKKMDMIIANSNPTAEIASRLNIKQQKIKIIHPGVSLPGVYPNHNQLASFRREYDLGNRKLLLSVGRLVERKGIKEFVKYSLPQIVEHFPDILLIVIGTPPIHSLYAKPQTPESIMEAAEELGVKSNIKFLGAVTDSTLHLAYAASSVHVFPIKKSLTDPEGFGMVAIEAAAYGLPSVAFASGGIGDAVLAGSSGLLVPPDDYVELSKKIIVMLNNDGDMRQSSKNFAMKFSWDNFGKALKAELHTVSLKKKKSNNATA